MFQKEVAERIVAEPGSDAYGRLAVIAQATSVAKTGDGGLAPGLHPAAQGHLRRGPHRSARRRLEQPLLDRLQTLTAAAFGQRRKMLRSSLKQMGGEALCETAGIDPSRRAETLDVEEFLALARAR
jgi:16S rRNA (adenine1518-N6/adenine1519-N6)-dimethyltransferase